MLGLAVDHGINTGADSFQTLLPVPGGQVDGASPVEIEEMPALSAAIRARMT
jgi:hypothetical protein